MISDEEAARELIEVKAKNVLDEMDLDGSEWNAHERPLTSPRLIDPPAEEYTLSATPPPRRGGDNRPASRRSRLQSGDEEYRSPVTSQDDARFRRILNAWEYAGLRTGRYVSDRVDGDRGTDIDASSRVVLAVYTAAFSVGRVDWFPLSDREGARLAGLTLRQFRYWRDRWLDDRGRGPWFNYRRDTPAKSYADRAQRMKPGLKSSCYKVWIPSDKWLAAIGV
jgi:hypothetical protein